jgi:hypothetical protein
MRNLITLSDIPTELHQWYKDEAHRRTLAKKTHVPLYTVINEALNRYMAEVEQARQLQPPPQMPNGSTDGSPPARKTRNHDFDYFINTGGGPYPDVRTALQNLDIPEAEKPKHNRYERLSAILKVRIQRRPKTEAVTDGR